MKRSRPATIATVTLVAALLVLWSQQFGVVHALQHAGEPNATRCELAALHAGAGPAVLAASFALPTPPAAAPPFLPPPPARSCGDAVAASARSPPPLSR